MDYTARRRCQERGRLVNQVSRVYAGYLGTRRPRPAVDIKARVSKKRAELKGCCSTTAFLNNRDGIRHFGWRYLSSTFPASLSRGILDTRRALSVPTRHPTSVLLDVLPVSPSQILRVYSRLLKFNTLSSLGKHATTELTMSSQNASRLC